MEEKAVINDELKREKNEMDDKYLTFSTAEQLFGIAIEDIVQIIGIQQITEIPEFPSYAKGIINLRGEIIPIIDMRLRFGKPEIAYDDKTCIIVMNIREKLTGIIVDRVEEVTNIEEDEISPPPSANVNYVNTYLSGIGKRNEKVVLLLNTDKIVGAEQYEAINTAMT